MGDFVLKIEAPSAKKRDTIRAAPTDYAGELLKRLLKKVRPLRVPAPSHAEAEARAGG